VSSFTGYWFVNELLNEGHEIVVTFTKKNMEEYNGIRKDRVGVIEKMILWGEKILIVLQKVVLNL